MMNMKNMKFEATIMNIETRLPRDFFGSTVAIIGYLILVVL